MEHEEVLDFEHEPKDYRIRFSKPLVITPELAARAEARLKQLKLGHAKRFKWRR